MENNAFAAWCDGYYYGSRGFVRVCPRGTWLMKFFRDFYAGYDAGVRGF